MSTSFQLHKYYTDSSEHQRSNINLNSGKIRSMHRNLCFKYDTKQREPKTMMSQTTLLLNCTIPLFVWLPLNVNFNLLFHHAFLLTSHQSYKLLQINAQQTKTNILNPIKCVYIWMLIKLIVIKKEQNQDKNYKIIKLMNSGNKNQEQ